ncbi:MAG: preprotein translocase subunit SecE [Patescibacteria group bacterium]
MKNKHSLLRLDFLTVVSRNNFIVKYFIESWGELSKVTWPTRKQIINHTVIVLASVIIAMGVTATLDYGLSSLVQLIVERGL